MALRRARRSDNVLPGLTVLRQRLVQKCLYLREVRNDTLGRAVGNIDHEVTKLFCKRHARRE